MSKIAIIVLLTIFSWLQVKLWLKPNGIKDIIKLNNKVIQETNKLDALYIRNKELFNTIEQLKNQPNAIEEQARVILGMIKNKETFYRLIETNNNENTSK